MNLPARIERLEQRRKERKAQARAVPQFEIYRAKWLRPADVTPKRSNEETPQEQTCPTNE